MASSADDNDGDEHGNGDNGFAIRTYSFFNTFEDITISLSMGIFCYAN